MDAQAHPQMHVQKNTLDSSICRITLYLISTRCTQARQQLVHALHIVAAHPGLERRESRDCQRCASRCKSSSCLFEIVSCDVTVARTRHDSTHAEPRMQTSFVVLRCCCCFKLLLELRRVDMCVCVHMPVHGRNSADSF